MARWSVVRTASCVIGLAALAACGSGPGDPDGTDLIFPEGRTCLNCGGTETPEAPQQIVASEHLTIIPDLLTFYTTAETENVAKELTVTNRTKEIVLLTKAFVADNPLDHGDENGAEYFATEPFGDKIELQPGESAGFWVSFIPSTRQRSAVFVVHTTDLDYSSLVSQLTGKHFLDGGF